MTGLFLLVSYDNMGEVDQFIDHVASFADSPQLRFSICDNSPHPCPSTHHADPRVTITARSDNPGYLEGGLVALETYVATHAEMPDWIFLSNTDLRFHSEGALSVLASNYESSTPIVIAPRILERDVDMNPHLVHRRSVLRLKLNHAMTATPLLSAGYLLLNIIRKAPSRLRPAYARGSEPRLPNRTAGVNFYSPYGALVIFSRGFFETGEMPRNVPLLAEEYFIAETAADIGAPVTYEPRIVVHHQANTTTGPKVSLRRARLLSEAFSTISTHATQREQAST